MTLISLAACSELSIGAKGTASEDAGNAYGLGDTGGAGQADTDADEDGAPETEDDYLKLAPAVTDTYVFVANPDRDTVTRVSVSTLEVLTAVVGDHPSVVVTSSDYSRAVTFNEGSDDVSIIDAETMGVTNVPVREDFNRMSLSDDGEWVMCWYDPDSESQGGSGGVQSFNEVSFVRLDDGMHAPMAVGPKPHAVRWTADGTRAIVVSDASLAIVDLTAEELSPVLVAIAEDAQDAPPAEEIELAGNYGYVRQYGVDEILAVDLTELAVTALPAGDTPTDLDLSPDGATVTVVARGSLELYTFDAANPFVAPTILPFPSDNPYGSMLFTADGSKAILYTNASAVPSFGLWDVASGEIEERSLVKPVAMMGLSPTGDSLLAFHTKSNADGADPTSPFYNEYALTLVDLSDFRDNPMVLAAAPQSYTVSDDGRYGFFVMESLKYLEMLNFSTLLVDEIALPSLPVHIGTLPESTWAWASQDHSLGRMSFYDPDADTLDTLTGFELNADIEHN